MGKIYNTFRQTAIDQLVKDIADSNTSYYVFTAKTSAWPDDVDPPAEDSSIQSSAITPHHEMLFGIKIDQTDTSFVIPKIVWASNTVYSRYDHRDENLVNENYYVCTTGQHVYKCIDNNNSSPSTSEPQVIQTAPFVTDDGYMWKYMYSFDSVANTKFATSDYIPVVPNAAVTSAAVDGIDVISVEQRGAGYNAIHSGNVLSVVNTTVFQIDTTSSFNSDFYSKSAFYIDSGAGAGGLSQISSYVVNSSGHYVQTSSPITGVGSLVSSYQIAPYVSITGDGTGAKAIATVNTLISSTAVFDVKVIAPGTGYANNERLVFTSNVAPTVNASGYILTNNTGGITSVIIEISGSGYVAAPALTVNTVGGYDAQLQSIIGGYPLNAIEVIAPGSGYTRAKAEVIANSAFGAGSEIVPIIGPIGGHGANSVEELNSKHLMISTRYSDIDANNRLSTTYRVIGLLRNPTQASNSAVLYESNSFNQVIQFTTTPTISWSVGSSFLGLSSGSQGIIAEIANGVVSTTGDQTFANNEVIRNTNTAETATITSIEQTGDLSPFSGCVLYTHNIVPNQRFADQIEVFKLAIEY